jgi:hypothetical protein
MAASLVGQLALAVKGDLDRFGADLRWLGAVQAASAQAVRRRLPLPQILSRSSSAMAAKYPDNVRLS